MFPPKNPFPLPTESNMAMCKKGYYNEKSKENETVIQIIFKEKYYE